MGVSTCRIKDFFRDRWEMSPERCSLKCSQTVQKVFTREHFFHNFSYLLPLVNGENSPYINKNEVL
jgi:hypothetical protein